jgi:hypothetical protein
MSYAVERSCWLTSRLRLIADTSVIDFVAAGFTRSSSAPVATLNWPGYSTLVEQRWNPWSSGWGSS